MNEKSLNKGLLSREFYSKDSVIVAREILGKVLVHEVDGRILRGKIVETEAYMGIEDKAAHTYGGRRTKRVEAMYGKPGTAYVYLIYGMYNCINVVTKAEEIPQGALIRGLEPLSELDYMAQRRFNKSYSELNKTQVKGLTNGPGKLCMAMNIDRRLNNNDFLGDKLYIIEGEKEEFNIVESKRVGIDYAEEAKDYLWRFYIEGNKYVSVK